MSVVTEAVRVCRGREVGPICNAGLLEAAAGFSKRKKNYYRIDIRMMLNSLLYIGVVSC